MNRTHGIVALTGALAALLATAPAASGYWPGEEDLFRTLDIARTTLNESTPVSVGDGAGGVIVIYEVAWGLDEYLCAQHVLSNGVIDPAWPTGGRTILTYHYDQDDATAVPDGSGGVVLAWLDGRGGSSHYLYAHHLRADGQLDPSWPSDGLAVCTATGDRFAPVMESDGHGGGIVAWLDMRGGSLDVYAQHLLPAGAVDPAWPAGGRLVCGAAGQQTYPAIASDGRGGAIVAWRDLRGADADIYAQHVWSTGGVDVGWPADGRRLCAAAGDQSLPALIPDQAYGALVTWQDGRVSAADVYAQHVRADGTLDPAWPANGRGVCTASDLQAEPRIVSDGGTGAVIAWIDHRGTPYVECAVYAQHVLAGGTVDPGWTADGRMLHAAGAFAQSGLRLLPDGVGGAIAGWCEADELGWYDWVHHVRSDGVPDTLWSLTGRFLPYAGVTASPPSLATDGRGGVIIGWCNTSGSGGGDILGRRVDRWGAYSGEPRISWIRDNPFDQGGYVGCYFETSQVDRTMGQYFFYDYWRQVPVAAASARIARGAHMVAEGEAPGKDFAGALMTRMQAGVATYWELVGGDYQSGASSGMSAYFPTACDSSAAGNPLTQFMVEASRYYDGGRQWWFSDPAPGYSVDNLAPASPRPFTGQYTGGVCRLHWPPSTASDFAVYRLYRAHVADFPISAANRIATQADTGYVDNAGAPYWYKLTAVDIHGNESVATYLQPAGTVGVPGVEVPRVLALSAPAPNPLRASATMSLALPAAGRVVLDVFDQQGRRVRTLADGVMPAGERTIRWDGGDDRGRPVASALYFVRLRCAAGELVRRVVVTH